MKTAADFRTMLDDVERILEEKKKNDSNSALDEISAALASIVEYLEKGVDLGSVVAALKTMKLNATMEAPKVDVNVSPTPVTFEAVMPNLPAPVVNVSGGSPVGAEWEVKTVRTHEGQTMSVRRVK